MSISIKTLSGSQNIIVAGDLIINNVSGNYEREKYLLDLVVKLVKDKQLLKDEIKQLKSKKQKGKTGNG